jgi:hypothetical protein
MGGDNVSITVEFWPEGEVRHSISGRTYKTEPRVDVFEVLEDGFKLPMATIRMHGSEALLYDIRKKSAPRFPSAVAALSGFMETLGEPMTQYAIDAATMLDATATKDNHTKETT